MANIKISNLSLLDTYGDINNEFKIFLINLYSFCAFEKHISYLLNDCFNLKIQYNLSTKIKIHKN